MKKILCVVLAGVVSAPVFAAGRPTAPFMPLVAQAMANKGQPFFGFADKSKFGLPSQTPGFSTINPVGALGPSSIPKRGSLTPGQAIPGLGTLKTIAAKKPMPAETFKNLSSTAVPGASGTQAFIDYSRAYGVAGK